MKNLKIVVLTCAIFILAGCGGINYAKLEKELNEKASTYYEENLKDKVLNIDNHKVSIEALESSGVDVTSFTDAKCDKTASYVLIQLELDDEGKQVGDYQTEVHLTCGDYTTATE